MRNTQPTAASRDQQTEFSFEDINLKLLPLMYTFELQDILFAIKSLKSPTNQFNIQNFITLTLPTLDLGLAINF